MPVFSYTGFDEVGRRVRGSLTADTAAAGRARLQERGLRLQAFAPARLRRVGRGWDRRPGRRREEQVAGFARQLSLLLRAGVSLVEALDVLVRQEAGRLGVVLRDVRERVAGGASLAEALEGHGSWFDGVFRSAVGVGQLSGQMDAALGELAEYVRERQVLRNRLFSALAYPAVLVVVATGVVLFLMTQVVPQLMLVLEASGRPLPAATRLLKGSSDVLVSQWPVLAAAGLVLVSGVAGLRRWRRGLRWCHQAQLRAPLFGVLVRKRLVAQFAQVMSLLLRSGVPFLEALRLVRVQSRHLVLASELGRMEEAVERGSDIAPTLAGSRVFPPLVMHVVNVGQKTGELTAMLGQLDEGYRTEVRLAVEKFSAALEPLLIVVMSVVIGFIVFATMTPILEATRAIH